ncbi:MAG: class I SAM-dependent methyltransferase [Sphingomonadales bacterium]|nr:class I SAM-dependent methyltransferase [Sphingomonadales bacterium]
MPRRLKPHMHRIEFAQLLEAVQTSRPRHFLEWGAGGSTAALLAACPFIERFISVEHDAKWADVVTSSIDDPRLELHLRQPAEPEPPAPLIYFQGGRRDRWRKRAETDPALLADYAALPAGLGIIFDFVLVDGRARSFCAHAGWELLRPGGTLALHDAQRPEYRATLEKLGAPEFLTPWKRGQICLLRKPQA